MTTPDTHTLGRIEFVPYDKYPRGTSPAPSAIELARLYDRAAQRIAELEAEITRLRSQILDLQSS